MNITEPEQLEKALLDIGVRNAPAAVHTAFSSFGQFHGGVIAFLDVLCRVMDTAIFPAYYEQAHILPTDYLRVKRNGLVLENIPRDRWIGAPFDERTSIDASMGIVSCAALGYAGALRSDHPTHSWVGVGNQAHEILSGHTLDDLLLPLKRLYDLNGHVLLIGVDLRRCTAVHLAEEHAGRPHLIRWVRVGDTIVDCRIGSDSKGFHQLEPFVGHLARRVMVGGSLLQAYPIRALVDAAADAIRQNPEVTRCSPDCRVCADVIAGGPYLEP